MNDSVYAVNGFIYRISNPNPTYIFSDSSRYLEIDKQSLEVKVRQSFYVPQDSIYTSRIFNMLEKDGFKYLFAMGYVSDTINLVSPMYMLKVNQHDSIVKFSKVDPPRKSFTMSGVEYLEVNGFMSYPPSLEWISDTSFLFVTCEPTSYPKVWPGSFASHGDVHFLVYDTAFNLINSNRLEIHDTSNYTESPMLEYGFHYQFLLLWI